MNRPFVFFAGEDWWYHNHAHADFQLAMQVSKTRPALVVNSIGMRLPTKNSTSRPLSRIFRKLKSTTQFLKRPLPDLPNFWVLSVISLPVFGYKSLEKINAISIAVQVKAAMKFARMGKRPDVLVTVPTAFAVLEHLDTEALGYLRADDHGADPEVNSIVIKQYEDLLFERSNRVFYASEALMVADGTRNKGKGEILDHGVDLDLFRVTTNPAEPADLAAIAHPRLGCFGTIENQGTDIALIRHVAENMPEANIVLIGRSAIDLTDLLSLPNVHHLGYKDHSEIPSYGQGFDVALLPRPMDDWNSHSNPIKIKEYLALGLTIVATDFPESKKIQNLVRIGSTYDSFTAQCRRALTDPIDPAVAISSVQSASWAARSRQLTEALASNAAVHR
jgi:glycosyltransferase involved in cell wall biosynthesis